MRRKALCPLKKPILTQKMFLSATRRFCITLLRRWVWRPSCTQNTSPCYVEPPVKREKVGEIYFIMSRWCGADLPKPCTAKDIWQELLTEQISGIGHSVIRGLITSGQWFAASSAVYGRESPLGSNRCQHRAHADHSTFHVVTSSTHMPLAVVVSLEQLGNVIG